MGSLLVLSAWMGKHTHMHTLAYAQKTEVQFIELNSEYSLLAFYNNGVFMLCLQMKMQMQVA